MALDKLHTDALPGTIKNQSLEDSSNYIVDSADTTKKLQFQLSGLTTGTTRTITVPDADRFIA